MMLIKNFPLASTSVCARLHLPLCVYAGLNARAKKKKKKYIMPTISEYKKSIYLIEEIHKFTH